MRPKLFLMILAAVLTLSVGFFATDGFTDSKIVIKGSTTVLPITQKAIEAFTKIRKDVAISVDGSGSGNGIKALLDGTTDIANSSRSMKDKELATAASKGLKIKEIACAYDMIVVIVNKQNTVKNLTSDQLKGIYDGTITNWKDVGGPDQRIVVVSRDTSSGTYEYWNEHIMKKGDVTPKAQLQASNGAVLTTVANNPKAIGYIGFGYVNNTIKVLDVDGVKATILNGKTGKYPISRKLFMYVNEKNYSPDAKAFVNFILGVQGQKLVKDADFIPLH